MAWSVEVISDISVIKVADSLLAGHAIEGRYSTWWAIRDVILDLTALILEMTMVTRRWRRTLEVTVVRYMSMGGRSLWQVVALEECKSEASAHPRVCEEPRGAGAEGETEARGPFPSSSFLTHVAHHYRSHTSP